MSRAAFVVTTRGVVIPVVEARETPRREELRRASEPIGVGDWVAPLPGRGLDFVNGFVERADECAGLEDDLLLAVRADSHVIPYMVRASEVYRTKTR